MSRWPLLRRVASDPSRARPPSKPSTLRFLPDLAEGPLLTTLRSRSVIMAHGGGRYEHPEQDCKMAALLGSKGIPNRVDAWGEEQADDLARAGLCFRVAAGSVLFTVPAALAAVWLLRRCQRLEATT